jgi:hypothetical protein
MEFKRTNIFAGLGAKAQAGHGNVTPLRSVPAVDRLMLDVALGKIAEIERTLEGARDAARATARRAGVSGSYLFGETRFLPRSTAQRWRDEALERGKAERTALLIRVAEAVKNPDPRFAGVGEALRRGMERGAFNTILGEADPNALDEAEAEAEAAARAKTTAEQILAAGERARRDGANERPEPTGLAKKILDAGRKAHRKIGDDQ